ncbi:hypothetical protein BEWA_021440 [Theileria equi strain WA]|uniref:Uncharacterized protein n=1 Tax=Theileria equi strain WA TaxID=1537102 RepID=L0AW92_THEEQ|nr:hypothetical protein BEWA_021440 [Theileria equi strain WA]AFZ79296.1 hypothetical protein BEWA_021440 [Theileria equi strain WA]|eukprot:XP_004828962.1 hypothetical protein BEWA_021440 [Theileria equi strain WA]
MVKREVKVNDTPDESSPSGDPVVEESLILLDFPEFHSTCLFNDSSFEPALEENSFGTLHKITNCSFNKIDIGGIDTKTPMCILNDHIPFSGTHMKNGLTYVLIDKDSLQLSEDETKIDSGSTEEKSVWYTRNCVEFTAKL